MIVRVGARLLASPFQLLPLPAWHLFNLSFLSLSATVIIVGVAVIMHKLTVVATWIGEGDRSTGILVLMSTKKVAITRILVALLYGNIFRLAKRLEQWNYCKFLFTDYIFYRTRTIVRFMLLRVVKAQDLEQKMHINTGE
ncbi:uncharacterized protein [Zea mays]|uniref:uncharacterized protein n=1 Tax=Zea mays TaxID=4577 RepID=UPI0004DE8581|nr:uncharacterized protein LOC103653231 [Zea mays]|eukprot:XP_008678408.1 uncharacterized protein LOC103653231 [Zea mays]